MSVCYYMLVTDWCIVRWLLQRQDHVEMEDLTVARESLEVLTVCLMLCPPALDALNKDKSWQTFIKDLLLHCKNRSVLDYMLSKSFIKKFINFKE